MAASRDTTPIAVLGAGGRAGRAVTAEAVRRGHEITAIVRDPARHDDLHERGVTVVAGDALDPASITRAASGARALVSAVTPFSTPPVSLDGFDTGHYARIADALTQAARRARIARVVVIGHFATLHVSGGRLVLDDPGLFPDALRPFALAHAAGVDRLRGRGGGLDWLVLAPPPNLSPATPCTGRYRLGDDALDPQERGTPLSYADLAAAVVDQIDEPTRHQEHAAVYGS